MRPATLVYFVRFAWGDFVDSDEVTPANFESCHSAAPACRPRLARTRPSPPSVSRRGRPPYLSHQQLHTHLRTLCASRTPHVPYMHTAWAQAEAAYKADPITQSSGSLTLVRPRGRMSVPVPDLRPASDRGPMCLREACRVALGDPTLIRGEAGPLGCLCNASVLE